LNVMPALRSIAAFIDERTGLRKSVTGWVDQPAVGGSLWALAMATSVAACLGVLALTGVLLMTAYSPSPQSAWASVHYVQFVQDRGWIVRGLHYWAAQALLVLAALHVVYLAFAGGHKKPREIGWWLTLLVLGLAVGEAITGGLLPWDQLGWWARVVEGNIVGLAPVVGGWIEEMIAGGPELGALGLNRAYTAHVLLLPPLIGLAVWGRRALARRHGWSDPPAAPADTYARQLARNVLVALAVVVFVFGLTGWAHGAPLDGPADPMSDYPARPEWFLLSMFQLRKFFHGAMEFWGTSLVPGAAAACLVLLPWIARGERSRALALATVVAIFGGAVVLGVVAWRHGAHDAQYIKARAKADSLAAAAAKLAMNGVPPEGALAMVRRDPELHGQDLFERHCASCHVLGTLGDPKKATATKLDGWGTAQWIKTMMHDPDAPEFFGRGPYVGKMPSVDRRPKDVPQGQPWTPIIKSEAEKMAVALFLASQGDEPGDPPRPIDEPTRALGEKIVSERCSTCHLYKGDGDEEGSNEAPELAHFGSFAWTRAQVGNPSSVETYREKALSEELKKHMPRFDKELSAADVEVVARWTRSHARAAP
jgi:ubiquinol-cytochrome c reductase cytochrome b subunit